MQVTLAEEEADKGGLFGEGEECAPKRAQPEQIARRLPGSPRRAGPASRGDRPRIKGGVVSA